jgi:hypothetical protein
MLARASLGISATVGCPDEQALPHKHNQGPPYFPRPRLHSCVSGETERQSTLQKFQSGATAFIDGFQTTSVIPKKGAIRRQER